MIVQYSATLAICSDVFMCCTGLTAELRVLAGAWITSLCPKPWRAKCMIPSSFQTWWVGVLGGLNQCGTPMLTLICWASLHRCHRLLIAAGKGPFLSQGSPCLIFLQLEEETVIRSSFRQAGRLPLLVRSAHACYGPLWGPWHLLLYMLDLHWLAKNLGKFRFYVTACCGRREVTTCLWGSPCWSSLSNMQQ